MGIVPQDERYRARAARLRLMLRRMRYPEARLQLLCLIREFETLAALAERHPLRFATGGRSRRAS